MSEISSLNRTVRGKRGTMSRGDDDVIAIWVNDQKCYPWYEIHPARFFTGHKGKEFGLTRFFDLPPVS